MFYEPLQTGNSFWFSADFQLPSSVQMTLPPLAGIFSTKPSSHSTAASSPIRYLETLFEVGQ